MERERGNGPWLFPCLYDKGKWSLTPSQPIWHHMTFLGKHSLSARETSRDVMLAFPLLVHSPKKQSWRKTFLIGWNPFFFEGTEINSTNSLAGKGLKFQDFRWISSTCWTEGVLRRLVPLIKGRQVGVSKVSVNHATTAEQRRKLNWPLLAGNRSSNVSFTEAVGSTGIKCSGWSQVS